MSSNEPERLKIDPESITYEPLDIHSEPDFERIRELISADLSEPYCVYVYRFFLHEWPQLCYLAKTAEGECIGVVMCKLEPHRDVRLRGYIGMLAVETKYRGNSIAKRLVLKSIEAMIEQGADEVMLETEVVNKPALGLYENMGFIRSKRLFRYYLNQHDAYRLILPLGERSVTRSTFLEPLI